MRIGAYCGLRGRGVGLLESRQAAEENWRGRERNKGWEELIAERGGKLEEIMVGADWGVFMAGSEIVPP